MFLGGFVRKDIQYSEAIGQTATTVEGILKDFVIQIPFTCVVDLGCSPAIPPTLIKQQFQNPLPDWELIFSLINEMDDALDRVPLRGGPIEEGIFKTLQEKMVILIQLQLTFPTAIDPPRPHCHCAEPICEDHPSPNVCCCCHTTVYSTTVKLLKSFLRSMSR